MVEVDFRKYAIDGNILNFLPSRERQTKKQNAICHLNPILDGMTKLKSSYVLIIAQLMRLAAVSILLDSIYSFHLMFQIYSHIIYIYIVESNICIEKDNRNLEAIYEVEIKESKRAV